MPLIDFSETKRQWMEIRRGVIRTWAEDMNEKLGKGFGQFLKPLFLNLPKNEAVRWVVFSFVSISFTIMILHFVNAFSEDQEKYQTVLTSVGRNRVEYNALNYVGTTTGEEEIRKK